jgi:hypothetical protein
MSYKEGESQAAEKMSKEKFIHLILPLLEAAYAAKNR